MWFTKTENLSALVQLKRGSVQVQRAAKEVKEKIDHPHILTILLTIAFAIGGIIEQSSSVALLANNNTVISAEEFAQYVENTSYITRLCNAQDNITSNSNNEIGRKTVHAARSIPHIEIPMSQNEATEAILREAFMWGCLISPLAASRIAARVGAERVMGYAILGAGAAAVLIPAAWLSPAHVAIRIFQGMCVAATWPAAHMLAVSWIDLKNISCFVSCYTAVNLGYTIVGFLGIPLVRTLGRDSICYFMFLIVFMWFFVWWRFVEDVLLFRVPKQETKSSVPWRHLLSSPPVWACSLAVLGGQWADAILMLGVLKYLKLVYGYSTFHDDILSTLPNIGHFVAAITFGFVVDHVRSSGIVSTTTARKLFVYISHFVPAGLIFVLGYTGCDPAAPAALYTAALTLSGATPAGAYASAIDLAPEYSGTIFGLATTMGAAGLLAANYVVREGLHGSFAGWWRLVFGIASAELLITAGIFMAIGRGCAQKWSVHYCSKDDTETFTNSIELCIPTVSITPAEDSDELEEDKESPEPDSKSSEICDEAV